MALNVSVWGDGPGRRYSERADVVDEGVDFVSWVSVEDDL